MDLPTAKRVKQFHISVGDPQEFRTAFLAAVARELEYERLVELNVTDNSIVFRGGIFRPRSLGAGTLNYIDHGEIKVTVEEALDISMLLKSCPVPMPPVSMVWADKPLKSTVFAPEV